jgi:hypothetical protein
MFCGLLLLSFLWFLPLLLKTRNAQKQNEEWQDELSQKAQRGKCTKKSVTSSKSIFA